MTRPPRSLRPRIIYPTMSGSCDDPSDRGRNRHREGVTQPRFLIYPIGKRDSDYLYGSISFSYLRCPLKYESNLNHNQIRKLDHPALPKHPGKLNDSRRNNFEYYSMES
ncbi:hypothetical protein AVEN_13960-1 [Araneus ventricosus]|uniref:Uncharacterized protein n=1 Tax=Araneus ventricosus TaxID=182803 RepID=A0A4Y2WLX2_ARAVE|nr:hypothetical protein AVEN_95365-1 [Araneus ventricosus]GBO37614.1 hypothetical protein AVEN_13960-1 [Araneus ventricosus]